MKALGRFLTAALFGSIALYGQAVKDPSLPNPVRVSTRLQMVASLEKENVKLGEPVVVHAHVRNVSSEVIARIFTMFQAVVTDSSGAEPPRTLYGKNLLTAFDFSPRTDRLAAGAEGEDVLLDVGKIYELTRPGRYFLRASVGGLGAVDRSDPRLKSSDPKEVHQIPLEEAVSDLIPFRITP